MQYVEVLAQVVEQVSEKPDPWWTVVAGIIAVPAAVLGLFYTSALIKKTGLESRKMELEIAEGTSKLETAETHPAVRNLTQVVAGPLIAGRRAQELLLRFIVLYLVLQAWNVVGDLFNIVQLGFASGVADAVINRRAGALETTTFVVFLVLQELPRVGHYLVLFGLGIPILTDALRQLNIKQPRVLGLLQAKYSLMAVGIVVLVSSVGPDLVAMLQFAGRP